MGVMGANDLRQIAAADTRRQEVGKSDRYTGSNGELSKKRQIEIKEYISTFDAAFPNSFIISVKSEDVLSHDDGVLKNPRS